MARDLNDPRRIKPTYLLAERDMLEAWLEFQRATLLMKVEGLTDEERKRRPIVSSLLSLHGLVRHMAEVEQHWFTRVLANQPDLVPIWSTPNTDDAEFAPLDSADWQYDLDIWLGQCESSRVASKHLDLDAAGRARNEAVSLRWIYVHMIEEYARHNGHADLIRELIDKTVGW